MPHRSNSCRLEAKGMRDAHMTQVAQRSGIPALKAAIP
jgi:hypothetical protein